MPAQLAKNSFLKLLALFTVIRGYNVAVLVIAMYLTSYFIFEKDTTLSQFFSNYKLHLIVMASAFTVSAGYILNNFYDLDKDQISRPISVYISRFVSQNFKLIVYLAFCLIAVILAFSASWRVGLFFLIYQFMVWLYSHKLNRNVFTHNLMYVILSLFPFLALLLFYNNYAPIIFFHAWFLGLLLLIMDISKDFVSYRADLIYNYKTLPATIGKKASKIILNLIILIALVSALLMTQFPEVGHMKLYFWMMALFLFFLAIGIWFSKKKWQYQLFYVSVKVMLGIGVLSLAWIKINPLVLQKFFDVY